MVRLISREISVKESTALISGGFLLCKVGSVNLAVYNGFFCELGLGLEVLERFLVASDQVASSVDNIAKEAQLIVLSHK